MNDERTLHHLARLHGIQVNYRDVGGQLQTATATTLRRLLGELGVHAEPGVDLAAAVEHRRRELWQRVVEPVLVAWDGKLSFRLRLPADLDADEAELEIVAEEVVGEPNVGRIFNPSDRIRLAALPVVRKKTVGGQTYSVREFTAPDTLPLGYFRQRLTIDGRTHESRIISAPQVAWQSHVDADAARSRIRENSAGSTGRTEFSRILLRETDEFGERKRLWGVFAPLYALHSKGSWGGGDFSDLERLMDWLNARGGDLVATLPLLASQFDFTDDPSPYSPTSRLFWNEFYVDVTRIPELDLLPDLKRKLASPEFQESLQSLRESPFVDYARQSALKRKFIEEVATEFFRLHPDGTDEFHEFLQREPLVESYARHRAVCERLGCLWPDWPEPLRNGEITPQDYDEPAFHYHLFAQWQVQRQLEAVAKRARDNAMVWYLDFPLGVNSHGYDVWKHRRLFATGAAAGAPPDAFFTKGQNWGLLPLIPDAIRDDGYRYLIAAFRRHLRFAKLLRIDHIMGLHRLYWVPQGHAAKDGAYVRYRLRELMAVLTLESHRHEAAIIGENLGTVPDVVNTAMNRHGIGDMYVVQYETGKGADPLLRPIPPGSVASLNTHDMPAFTAFWTGLDVDERVDLGLMDEADAAAERAARADVRREIIDYLVAHNALREPTRDPLAVQRAMLRLLGRSPAQVVFATLEDLWQETEPQNTPGTFKERRNWQRKLRFPFEVFTELPDVKRLLADLREARRGEEASNSTDC